MPPGLSSRRSTTRQGCDAIRPSFPSLHWPVESCDYAIYYLWDSWRFTLLWTLILYGIFHLSAAGVALFVQVGKHRSTWKYLWAVPIVYAFTAALEALVAGSVVGVLFVRPGHEEVARIYSLVHY